MFEDIHVQANNVHFGADTAAFEALCGSTYQFYGLNSDGSPINLVDGTTVIYFDQNNYELEYET